MARPGGGGAAAGRLAALSAGLLLALALGAPRPAAGAEPAPQHPRRRLMQVTPPDPSKVLANPFDCSGWLPEKRLYVEGQVGRGRRAPCGGHAAAAAAPGPGA
jgi:hypothetical protein